jgi:hypothetical protein
MKVRDRVCGCTAEHAEQSGKGAEEERRGERPTHCPSIHGRGFTNGGRDTTTEFTESTEEDWGWLGPGQDIAPTLHFPVSVTSVSPDLVGCRLSVVNILFLPRCLLTGGCTTEFTEFTEEGWGWLEAGHDMLLPSILFFLCL